jgi:hypothetical protein
MNQAVTLRTIKIAQLRCLPELLKGLVSCSKPEQRKTLAVEYATPELISVPSEIVFGFITPIRNYPGPLRATSTAQPSQFAASIALAARQFNSSPVGLRSTADRPQALAGVMRKSRRCLNPAAAFPYGSHLGGPFLSPDFCHFLCLSNLLGELTWQRVQ